MPVDFDYDENIILGVEFAGRVVGTKEIDGQELVLALAENLDGFDVVAVESEPLNQLELLPFFADVPVVDEDGEVTHYEPVTDITGKLQTFAGKAWTY